MYVDGTSKAELTMDFLGLLSGRNRFSLLKERRARWYRTLVCALIRACIPWRVAAARFLTRKPLTSACNLTSPLRARCAFLACKQNQIKRQRITKQPREQCYNTTSTRKWMCSPLVPHIIVLFHRIEISEIAIHKKDIQERFKNDDQVCTVPLQDVETI